MNIGNLNEEKFIYFLDREFRRTALVAPFIDIIEFAFDDLPNLIEEMRLPSNTTEAEIFANEKLLERINREFNMTARIATFEELADFAFGDYKAAVTAFKGGVEDEPA